MKKILLTITAVTTLAFASQAQTEKGKFLVGGTIGFETSKIKDQDTKENSFSINATVGYFVSDNQAIGTAASYEWGRLKPLRIIVLKITHLKRLLL